MLKVECEACKAPYQVDERRVPPTGLKMRCPKCGHSFVVQNPNAPAAAAKAPAPAPAAASPAVPAQKPPPPPKKATMVGMGAATAPAAPGPLPVDDPFAGIAPPTMTKAAPAARPPAPRPPQAGLPAALGGIDELDLPAVPDETGLPAIAQKKPPLPGQPRPKAGPPAPAKPNPPSLQDFEIDLPSVEAGLPSAKPAAPKGGPKAGLTFDVDFPTGAAELPSPKPAAARTQVGRPADPVVDLPSVSAGLPAVATGNLPALKRSGTATFGEIDLPMLGGDLPAVLPRDHNLPVVGGPGLPVVGGVGLPVKAEAQSHLPTAAGAQSHLPNVAGAQSHLPTATGAGHHLPSVSGPGPNLPTVLGESDFGDLELPRSNRKGSAAITEELDLSPDPSPSPAPAKGEARAGGVGYGEVDLGSSDGGAEIDAVARVAMPEDSNAARSLGGAEAAIPTASAPRRERPIADTRRSRAPRVILGVIVAMVLGGASLKLTPYGMFGGNVISDVLHESEYASAAEEGARAARAKLATDLFGPATAGLDELEALHQDKPRAHQLAAYAALAEYEAALRFGRDSARVARAKSWLDDVRAASPSARFLGLATAAQKALDGDLVSARKELDAASKRDAGDPVQQDIAMTRGELELAAKDPAAAVAAFTKAVQLAPSARSHYGLARAYALAGDVDKARTEIGAALAASPPDAGALGLRARLAWEKDKNETAAMKDLNEVVAGKAKAQASPADLGRAYALQGWIHFVRGRVGEARTAFDTAFKLDSSNVSALIGQGEVLFKEGRYTEALSHFDTAVQGDPTSVRAIVSDAKTKIALERLADAKTQLTGARQAIPGDMRVAFWLGKAEEALGNKKAAEDDYTAAIGLADPKAEDAIEPYMALSELLASEGRAVEAQAKLDQARQKLPDSAGMQRALGEVAAVQGNYDDAIQHYQSAIEKDPKDLSSRFLLGQTYRRMKRIDEASAAFDEVLAADKDYPNLAMERGLLYEQTGHVDKALDQFRAALAKAPDDPDLQLRVGAAYVAMGQVAEGLPMLTKVSEKRGTNSAEVNYWLGRAYFLKGGVSLPTAERFLKRAVDLDPNRPEFHLYLGWLADEQANLGLAQAEVGKALAIDKLLPEGYWQRGEVERKQTAVNDAITDLRKALQLKPTLVEAHAALAQCYEDKNDMNTAMAEWSKAIAGHDDRPMWRYHYGKILLDRGQVAAALPHLVYAVTEIEKMETAPGWSSDAEFAAAVALDRSHRKEEAIEHYHRFLDKAPTTSPDRHDALVALTRLGQPYQGN